MAYFDMDGGGKGALVSELNLSKQRARVTILPALFQCKSINSLDMWCINMPLVNKQGRES